jgi:DNA-damage-inducible protein J
MIKRASVGCRLDIQTGKKISKIFETMNLSTSKAIQLFLKEVVATGEIPFDVKRPNSTTIAAIRELEARTSKLFHPNS